VGNVALLGPNQIGQAKCNMTSRVQLSISWRLGVIGACVNSIFLLHIHAPLFGDFRCSIILLLGHIPTHASLLIPNTRVDDWQSAHNFYPGSANLTAETTAYPCIMVAQNVTTQ
jgi:hypothetical protein